MFPSACLFVLHAHTWSVAWGPALSSMTQLTQLFTNDWSLDTRAVQSPWLWPIGMSHINTTRVYPIRYHQNGLYDTVYTVPVETHYWFCLRHLKSHALLFRRVETYTPTVNTESKGQKCSSFYWTDRCLGTLKTGKRRHWYFFPTACVINWWCHGKNLVAINVRVSGGPSSRW